MIEAADSLGFPLIELPQNVSFIDIIQPLTTKILDLQANELIQSGNIHRQFVNLVLSGGGYPEIAEGISRLVERSVTIVDRFRRILANGLSCDREPGLPIFSKDDFNGDSYLTKEYKPEVLEEFPGREIKRMSITGPEGEIEHVVCPVQVGSLTLGQIIVWGPFDAPLQSIKLIAIEHGATVTALKMMEERSIREVEQRFQNEILESLLSDQPTSHEWAVYQLEELGLHLTPPFTIIMVGPDFSSHNLIKAERIEQSNINSSLHLAMRYIRAIQPNAVFWYQGPRLIIFLPLKSDQIHNSKVFLTKQLRQVCKRIEMENHPYTISMGISSAALELRQFRHAYDNAKQCLEMGKVIDGQSHSNITHYEDLGILRVTSLAQSPGGWERFCQEMIGNLLSYDRQYGTELVKTLRIYLEQSQNSAETARLLHIHYNTLRHRLDCIKGLIGDVLEIPQRRLNIEIALQIFILLPIEI
jgi:PucR family transcriptional regulator, purine catabolism regulatory protein